MEMESRHQTARVPHEMARTVAHNSKVVADAAHTAYEAVLPPEQRSFAAKGRVPPVIAGAPVRPVREAVAALGSANGYAALALDFSIQSVQHMPLQPLVDAAAALGSAGTQAVDSLHDLSAVTARLALAHSTARACYEMRDVLLASMGPATRRTAHLPMSNDRLPAWWRAVRDPLVQRLAATRAGEFDQMRMAAGAAYDAAQHLMRAYEVARLTGAAGSALMRCARGAALAAAYAAWSTLSVAPDSSAGSASPSTPFTAPDVRSRGV